jgi:hypothetical protein
VSDFVRDAIRKIAIVAAFACCAVMAAALLREAIWGGRFAHDYAVYWRTANSPAELAYMKVSYQPFPYAPPMLLWIAPLRFVSEPLGYVIVSIAGVVALMLACRPYLSKAALILMLISGPVVRCLRNGQISAVLAALMIWACGTRNRAAAGAAFAVVGSIKPQLVWLAPLMLLLDKDWRAIRAGVAASAVILGSGVAIYGLDRWPEWFGSLDHFHQILVDRRVVDIGSTPAIAAEAFGFDPLPFLIVGTVAGVGLVYLCRNTGPLEKATAIGAGSLLASPYALMYDLVIIAPFAATMVMKGRIAAFIPIAGMLHPLPLAVTAYELVRKKISFAGMRRLAGQTRRPKRIGRLPWLSESRQSNR